MVLKALGFVALFSLYLLKRLTFSSKTVDSCFCVYVGYPIIFFSLLLLSSFILLHFLLALISIFKWERFLSMVIKMEAETALEIMQFYLHLWTINLKRETSLYVTASLHMPLQRSLRQSCPNYYLAAIRNLCVFGWFWHTIRVGIVNGAS